MKKFRDGISYQTEVPLKACKLCSIAEVVDGFDLYTNQSDAWNGNGSQWDGAFSTLNIANGINTTTPFGYGRSLFNNGGGANRSILKITGHNQQTWFCSCWFMQTTALGAATLGFGFMFQDGVGSVQCSVYFDRTGNIIFYRGDQTAVVATWSGAFVANSFDHYQFKFVISGTVGEVHARKNGATSDSFSATGLNIQVSGVSTASTPYVRTQGATGISQFMDDVAFWTGDTSAKPFDWTGSTRMIQLQPVTDTAQKQFTTLSTGSLSFGDTTNNSTRALSSGTLQTGEIISATQGGTFTSVNVEFNAGFTGHAKLALYLADGNVSGKLSDSQPGHLVAVSNEVTNPTSGVNAFSFPSTVGIMKGYSYFFALLTDASATAKANSSTTTCYTYAVPGGYSGGFPMNLAGLTSSGTVTRATIYVTLTATNAGCISDEQQDIWTTNVLDNVLGDYDLYNLCPLPYVPINVIGVTILAQVLKTDAGGRNVKFVIKSGATQQDSAAQTPQTRFAYLSQHYPTDPNTGGDWSSAALNTLQIGAKVA